MPEDPRHAHNLDQLTASARETSAFIGRLWRGLGEAGIPEKHRVPIINKWIEMTIASGAVNKYLDNMGGDALP